MTDEERRRIRIFAMQISPLIKEYVQEHREEYEAFLREERVKAAATIATEEEKV